MYATKSVPTYLNSHMKHEPNITIIRLSASIDLYPAQCTIHVTLSHRDIGVNMGGVHCRTLGQRFLHYSFYLIGRTANEKLVFATAVVSLGLYKSIKTELF